MANQDRPNQNANKGTAEGERWSSDQHTIRDMDNDVRAENYPANDGDNAGGASNQPLDEEVDNQESVPARGTSRDKLDGESEKDRKTR